MKWTKVKVEFRGAILDIDAIAFDSPDLQKGSMFLNILPTELIGLAHDMVEHSEKYQHGSIMIPPKAGQMAYDKRVENMKKQKKALIAENQQLEFDNQLEEMLQKNKIYGRV